MTTPAAEIRRWVRARRAAEERELAEQSETRGSPGRSLRAALSLIALARARHGWPLPVDPESAEDDARAYARWARLRQLARR